MARSRRRRRRVQAPLALNLTTMIDVTFLLLIYFMVTTVLAQDEDRLTPTLEQDQEEQASGRSDFQPQIVRVRRAGTEPIYQLGERRFSGSASLAAALAQLPKEDGVFIRVNDGIPVGFAIAAVQAARDAGFEKVTYVPVR